MRRLADGRAHPVSGGHLNDVDVSYRCSESDIFVNTQQHFCQFIVIQIFFSNMLTLGVLNLMSSLTHQQYFSTILHSFRSF